MRLLFWLIGVPLAAAAVVFALSNRQTVVLGFWPFVEGLELPVYLAVLVPLAVGFAGGYVAALVRRLTRRLGPPS